MQNLTSPAGLSRFGVAPSFVDAFGQTRPLPQLAATLLADRWSGREPAPGPLIATPGRWHPDLRGTLTLEDGTVQRVDGFVHADGYHHLVTDDGLRRLVLAAPEYLPQPGRAFGLAVQLYAARSRDSWGIGDFRDLAQICRTAADRGAGAALISPVHAMAPTSRQLNSPYSPASRQFLNVLHIAPGAAPGAERVDLSDLAAAGRALNADRRIDRDAVWAVKLAALERIWAVVRDDEPVAFAEWVKARGPELETFATWCVLVETLPDADWRTWPAEFASPAGPGVSAFVAEHADRVRFLAWCQWVADAQFAAACASGIDVIVDLAVGFDAASADAWAYQQQLALNFEVGCPADPHNQEGQRWGLPPFDPHALAAAEFGPFVAMVRAGLRHAGALRIDHVMQLWRLFWIPVAGTAADGAYVHYPVDALLAVLRIEACRAGAWVVGEDMGTVADGVRDTMAAIGMLGYRTSMRTDPGTNPESSMGSSSTHDQATVAGILTCSDEATMARVGKAFDAEHIGHVRADLAGRAGLGPDGPFAPDDIARAVVAQHARLAASPSRVVVATLDDLGGVPERPNMPGTVDEYPNWRIALPVPVEDLLRTPLAGALFRVLQRP